jgi:hypothetical protein
MASVPEEREGTQEEPIPEPLCAGPTMARGGPAALRRKIQRQRQAIAKAMAKRDDAPRD